MKRILLAITILACSTSVYAFWPKPYVSVNAGYGYTDVAASNPHNYNRQQDGVAWGGNVGMLFNNYFGAEMGYNQLANTELNGSDYIRNPRVVDVALKGIYHGDEGYDFFAKAGVGQESFKYPSAQYIRKYVPVFAVGADYEITPHVLVNVTANATVAMGDNNGGEFPNRAPALYWGTAGVSYVF